MAHPESHRVYRSLNKPLLIWGVERRLFFGALFTGAATFNFFGSLLGGFLMFSALFVAARSATHTDPEILRILFMSATFAAHYDPAKLGDRQAREQPIGEENSRA